MAGADQEARLALSLEEAAQGGTTDISLNDPETGQTKTYTVTLPKGIRPGQRIRLARLGGRCREGGQAGDLYLHVELLPHATFRLERRDLYTTFEVSPWEAALGADATLSTLEGMQKSQEAVQAAQAKALRYGHVEVDGEHLLLALLEQADGLVPRLLTRMDIPLQWRPEVSQIMRFAESERLV